MPKAFGYCRLSKDETTVKCKACKLEWTLKIQDTEQTQFACPFCDHPHITDTRNPISIQAQSDTCIKLATERLPRNVDANLEIWADINVSGEIPIRDRPKGGELFAQLKTGDYLIVAKLDRAFRDLEDCCKQLKFFIRNGIKLLIGDIPDMDIHTPAGRMCLQMMAMFAEFERQRISERTKTGLAKRRELGQPVGHAVPIGYSLACTVCNHIYPFNANGYCAGKACHHCKTPRNGNTKHIPNPNEQAVMWRLLWERSAYFWKDWDLVAHDLTVDGVRSRSGATIKVHWCKKYWEDACQLLAEGNLLEEYRPAKMENFSIHKIPHIPKRVADYLEERSRGPKER